MKLYIITAILLIFFFIIKDFEVDFMRTSYNSETAYFDIDFIGVQAGEWQGSIFYFQYHAGIFQWDFLFLNSKISKIRG